MLQVRKVEYKDPELEEWEKFKKSIIEENKVSVVCVCLSVQVFVCMCASSCMHAAASISVCLCAYVYVHAYVSICVFVCHMYVACTCIHKLQSCIKLTGIR